MNHEVTMVRIYLTEEEPHLEGLVKSLHDTEQLRGLTLFRGISGYGDSGVIHDSRFIDLSLDLPVVLEFFDTPEKVERALEHLRTLISPGHIVTWSARASEAKN